MKQPYKHELREEIAQLREDLFTLIEACKDNDVLFPILVRNKWYYPMKFEREAEDEILKRAYGSARENFQMRDIS
jgi:hypothetical protein